MHVHILPLCGDHSDASGAHLTVSKQLDAKKPADGAQEQTYSGGGCEAGLMNYL